MPNNFGIIGDDAALPADMNSVRRTTRAWRRACPMAILISRASGLRTWIRIRSRRQMLPWAVAEWTRRRDASSMQACRRRRCLPTDPTLTLPVFYKIIQTRSLLVHLFEQDPHYRQAFLDGRGHPKDPDPTWMGHSRSADGRRTRLVIDTVGLNDKSWLLQATWLPHTEMLHIVERYTPARSRALEHRRHDRGPRHVHQTGRASRHVAVHARRRRAGGDLRREQQVSGIRGGREYWPSSEESVWKRSGDRRDQSYSASDAFAQIRNGAIAGVVAELRTAPSRVRPYRRSSSPQKERLPRPVRHPVGLR